MLTCRPEFVAKARFERMEVKMTLLSAMESQIRSSVGGNRCKKLSGQCRLLKAGSKRNKEAVASVCRSEFPNRAYGFIEYSQKRELRYEREIRSTAILSDTAAVGEWEEVSIFENIKHIEGLISRLREADTYRQKV